MASSWGSSWGRAWGAAWGATVDTVRPFIPVYSSMGRKRKQARLARLRKDDEIVLATIKAFLETRA